MTRLVIAMSVGVAILSAALAGAQTGNPAGMTPGTPQTAPGAPAAHYPNQADRTFVTEAAIAGMAEIEFGKLAQQRGDRADVKNFGERMVRDHTAIGDRLAPLAKTAGIPVPNRLDPEDQATHEELSKLSGSAFDHAYIRSQVADHQTAVQLFEYEINSGQDPALKSFASETLPILFQHLQMAQDIQMLMMSGQMPQASGAPGMGPSGGSGAQPPRN